MALLRVCENSAAAGVNRVRRDKTEPRIDKWRKAPGGRDARSIHRRQSREELRFIATITYIALFRYVPEPMSEINRAIAFSFRRNGVLRRSVSNSVFVLVVGQIFFLHFARYILPVKHIHAIVDTRTCQQVIDSFVTRSMVLRASRYKCLHTFMQRR